MRKAAVIAAALLILACGGSRIELNNATGMDLDQVTVTIGENTETFTDIEANQTFGTDLPITGPAEFIRLEWTAGGETSSMEYSLIERAAEAKHISILFAPDEVSVNYAF
ncbi:MAG TPA: hypothetical protein PKX02_08720 [Candidatus Sabulitectum sp.]|nr:hypothetical protein [Candidatus Sabulitectum sp.]